MKVEPLKRSFGAKVSELSLPDLNQMKFKIFINYGFSMLSLIFPQQNLTNSQQIEFAKFWCIRV